MKRILFFLLISQAVVFTSAQDTIHYLGETIINNNLFEDTSVLLYVERLESYLFRIVDCDFVDTANIDKVLPTTENEFFIYFSCDYNKNQEIVSAWQKIDNVFHYKAEVDSLICILYLNISEFVDGYYAEKYFDDLFNIIEHNNELFCDYYYKLTNSQTKHIFESYFKEFCHKK